MKLWVVCKQYVNPVEVAAFENEDEARFKAVQMVTHKREDVTISLKTVEADSLQSYVDKMRGWDSR